MRLSHTPTDKNLCFVLTHPFVMRITAWMSRALWTATFSASFVPVVAGVHLKPAHMGTPAWAPMTSEGPKRCITSISHDGFGTLVSWAYFRCESDRIFDRFHRNWLWEISIQEDFVKYWSREKFTDFSRVSDYLVGAWFTWMKGNRRHLAWLTTLSSLSAQVSQVIICLL